MAQSQQTLVVGVTGATAGIGRATVQKFARKGHTLAVLARDQDRLTATAKEAERLGSPRAVAYSVDVADHQALEATIETIESDLGSINVWINNAMATVFSPISKLTAQEFRRATEVTYLGSVYAILSVLPRMEQRGKGSIVQVGSALAYRGIPLQATYCGAKFGLRGFVDSLRTELLAEQSPIQLTMVQLPAHNTPQFSWARSKVNQHPKPVPPIYQPEVAAEAIYWATFNHRREVWVGPSAIATILLNKLFPGVIDKYLAITGYKSQVTDHQLDPANWPGNLFKPVSGDYGARGIFNDQAQQSTAQWRWEKVSVINVLARIAWAILATMKMTPNLIKALYRRPEARHIWFGDTGSQLSTS